MRLFNLNNIKIFVLYPLILLLLLVGTKFSFLPVGIAKIFVFFCISISFFIILRTQKVNKSLLQILCYLSLIILFIINHTLLMGNNIDSHAYIFLLNLTEFSLTSFFFVYLLKNELAKDHYMLIRIIVIAIVLHSLLIYLNVFIPTTRISENIIPIGGNINENSFGYLYRVRGLALSANAGLSIMHALGALLAYFIVDNVKLNKTKLLYSFYMIFILGSTLFISRTGFFMFFLVVGLYIIFINLNRLKNFIKNIRAIFLSLLILFIISVIIFNFFIDTILAKTIINKFLPWAFELFMQDNNGFLESRSTNDLFENMIFFPESEKTLLIGDGFYDGVNGKGHYIPSDSGYIRSIFAVGIIGTLFIYSFFIYMYIHFKKYFLLDKKLLVFLLLIVTILLIVEIKMPLIFAGPIIKIVYLLLFSQIIVYSLHRKKHDI